MSAPKKKRMIQEPRVPSAEEKQKKIDDIIAKGTKDGWFFVIASESYEKDEYIGPVDKDTAQEIVSNERYSYRREKIMYPLISLPSEELFRTNGDSIKAMIFLAGEASIGPFSDNLSLCHAVSKADLTPEQKAIIKSRSIKEIWFSAHNLLRHQ